MWKKLQHRINLDLPVKLNSDVYFGCGQYDVNPPMDISDPVRWRPGRDTLPGEPGRGHAVLPLLSTCVLSACQPRRVLAEGWR